MRLLWSGIKCRFYHAVVNSDAAFYCDCSCFCVLKLNFICGCCVNICGAASHAIESIFYYFWTSPLQCVINNIATEACEIGLIFGASSCKITIRKQKSLNNTQHPLNSQELALTRKLTRYYFNVCSNCGKRGKLLNLMWKKQVITHYTEAKLITPWHASSSHYISCKTFGVNWVGVCSSAFE